MENHLYIICLHQIWDINEKHISTRYMNKNEARHFTNNLEASTSRLGTKSWGIIINITTVKITVIFH